MAANVGGNLYSASQFHWFLREFRPLECTFCKVPVGYQHRSNGSIICVGSAANCSCLEKLFNSTPSPSPVPITADPKVKFCFSPNADSNPVAFRSNDTAIETRRSFGGGEEKLVKPEARKSVNPSNDIDTVDAKEPTVTEVPPSRKGSLEMPVARNAPAEVPIRMAASSTVSEAESFIEKSAPAPASKPALKKTGNYTWMDAEYSANLDDGAAVHIFYVWNPITFQVVADADSENLDAFQQVLAGIVEADKLVKLNRTPVANDMVVAEYEGCFYRGRVRTISEDSRKCLIEFVDYGDKAQRKINEVFEVPEELTKVPIFGMKIRLQDVGHTTIPAGKQMDADFATELFDTTLKLTLHEDTKMDPNIWQVMGVLRNEENKSIKAAIVAAMN